MPPEFRDKPAQIALKAHSEVGGQRIWKGHRRRDGTLQAGFLRHAQPRGTGPRLGCPPSSDVLLQIRTLTTFISTTGFYFKVG